MHSDLLATLSKRRSFYDINATSPVSDQEIQELLEFAVLETPSAFNSQSARLVLLFGEKHTLLWETTRQALRKVAAPESFQATSRKIDSFAAGHGTVLFYEDMTTIEKLQHTFPLYKDAFPGFSMNSSGMIQYVVWVLLREVGLGASLQHYGNLIEEEVAKIWNLPSSWRLIAQMPFGAPNSEPAAKEKLPVAEMLRVFS